LLSRVALTVPLVRDHGKEGVELEGAAQSAFEFDVDVRVRVESPVLDYPVTDGLRQNVLVSPSTLLLITDATVEVALLSCVHPEREKALGLQFVDELRDRSMNPLHHRSVV
jgi:hypothetical protein